MIVHICESVDSLPFQHKGQEAGGARGAAIPLTPVMSLCFTILSIRSLERFSRMSSAIIITPCV